jgi:hypothetical protein
LAVHDDIVGAKVGANKHRRQATPSNI